ncbi:MAG TPA: hypothetical protein VF650_13130 [Allosphingosinicella sp.]
MRGVAGGSRRTGGVVSPLLALLLLFRLLIPAGYMIAPDDSGRPGLVLCAASSGATAPDAGHSSPDGHPASEPSKPGEIPCPFAALAAPPLPPAPPALPPPAPVGAAPPLLTPGTNAGMLSLAAPPPPATGPPLPV